MAVTVLVKNAFKKLTKIDYTGLFSLRSLVAAAQELDSSVTYKAVRARFGKRIQSAQKVGNDTGFEPCDLVAVAALVGFTEGDASAAFVERAAAIIKAGSVDNLEALEAVYEKIDQAKKDLEVAEVGCEEARKARALVEAESPRIADLISACKYDLATEALNNLEKAISKADPALDDACFVASRVESYYRCMDTSHEAHSIEFYAKRAFDAICWARGECSDFRKKIDERVANITTSVDEAAAIIEASTDIIPLEDQAMDEMFKVIAVANTEDDEEFDKAYALIDETWNKAFKIYLATLKASRIVKELAPLHPDAEYRNKLERACDYYEGCNKVKDHIAAYLTAAQKIQSDRQSRKQGKQAA